MEKLTTSSLWKKYLALFFIWFDTPFTEHGQGCADDCYGFFGLNNYVNVDSYGDPCALCLCWFTGELQAKNQYITFFKLKQMKYTRFILAEIIADAAAVSRIERFPNKLSHIYQQL